MLLPDPFQKYRELLVKDQLLIIEGNASRDNFTNGIRLRLQVVYTLALAREAFAKKVNIVMHEDGLSEENVQRLKDMLILQERGSSVVYLLCKNAKAHVVMKLDPQWNMKCNEASMARLHQIAGVAAVEIEYA